LKYWLREPYLGIGAGAHSFDSAMRWANAHDPASYASSLGAGRLPIEQKEILSPEQSLDEEFYLGLRLLDGVDVARLEARYNVPRWTELHTQIARLEDQGLLERSGDRLRLAQKRLSISNEVFVELMN